MVDSLSAISYLSLRGNIAYVMHIANIRVYNLGQKPALQG